MSGQPSERDLAVFRSFARRIDPSDAGAHNNLGVFYYRKSLVEDAVLEFERALELDPRMQIAERNLEIAYTDTGFYDQKITALRENLRENPESREARWELGRIYLRLKQYDDSIDELSALLSKYPENVAALIQIGLAERGRGDLDAATEWFFRAKTFDPTSSLVHFYLGESYYNRGLSSDALEELTLAIDTNPDNAQAHYLLGFVLGDAGRHAEARVATRKAIQLNPALGRAHANLSLEKTLKTARRPEAEAGVASPTAVKPSTTSYLNLGLVFAERGCHADALREYRLGLDAGEERKPLLEAMAEVYLLKRDHHSALETYEILAGEVDDSPKILNGLGVALHQLGRRDEAVSSYEQSLQIDRANVHALNNLAVAKIEAEEEEEALDSLAKCVELRPEEVVPRLNYGLLLRQVGRYQEALDLYRLGLSQDSTDALIWNAIGVILTDIGKITEARNAYVRAVENDSSLAEVHYNLSFALSTLGEYDEALRAVTRAQEIDPYYVPQRFRLSLDLRGSDENVPVVADISSDVRGSRASEEFHVEQDVIDNIFAELFSPAPVAEEAVSDDDQLKLARDYVDKGWLDVASAEVNHALTRGADRVQAMILAGEIYAKRGLHREALEKYRSARAADLEDREATLGELRSLIEVGESGEALKLAESATKKLPDDGVLLSLLGRARAAAGDDAGALAALSEARQRIPHDAEIVCLAGDVARNSGDLEQAKQLYKDALALDPRSPRVHLALGKVCEAEGDLDGAEQSFLAAYQALPTYGEAAIALADLYRAKEATREAVDLLVDFLAADPADMRVLFSLGLALHDDGRGEAALVVFERVLARHEKHVPALYMAGVVQGKLKKYPEALAKWQKVIELDPGGPLAAKVRGHTQTAGDLQAIFETKTV